MADVGTPRPRAAGTRLRGRAGECAVLDDVVAALRRGESRTLMLQGEAGVGKTALLEYLLTTSASDLNVVRTIGVELEQELAFASLHQLCTQLLDQVDEMPPPQRRALRVAFGLSDGAAPDRYMVGLGVLSLLAAAAEEQPVLCVVDDVQWLDEASASALAFVSRRLQAERVGMVFAAREPVDAFRHVPRLHVPGMPVGEARSLLSRVVRFKMDEQVRDRIVAETRGNPLALLELPYEMTPAQLAGGFGILGAQTLPARIEDSFTRRLEVFSDDTRRLLLVAAAEPVGDPWLLWRASESLGIGTASAAVEEAEADGIVTIDQRVTFRHPLARSAVYRSATEQERRVVHAALAQATDRQVDPDRFAWHLAAATSGPDERVAAELERSAGRARARGGLAAAAAFLQRCVDLTDDPALRTTRALNAAQTSLEAGDFEASLELLATAEAGELDELQRAYADLLRGSIYFTSLRSSDAPALLLKAARELEPFDLESARATYLTAWGASLVAATPAGLSVHREICRAAQALPAPEGDPGTLELLLDGLARLSTEGFAAAAPSLKRAVRGFSDLPGEEVRMWGWIAVSAYSFLWDIEGMSAIAYRESWLLREAGALAALPTSLTALALSTAWKGDLVGSGQVIAEKDDVEAATGDRQPPYASLCLLALQGREEESTKASEQALELAAARGQGMATPWTQWTAAVLRNGLGRYKEALIAAREVTSKPSNWWLLWVWPELVESAVRAGEPDIAREGLDRLAESTQASGTDFALGIEARCRALLSEGTLAEELYEEAIKRLDRTHLRPELARTHLLYGEWLRRSSRRNDAREHLRTAYRMFHEMGMAGFAERAWLELHATGEKGTPRLAPVGDELTAQEQRIARLASEGLSNTEIGERLFLSSRTVEWHLNHVYRKLGIRSRREIPHALSDADSRNLP